MEGIGRLAAGVAHDFNNLLTAIGGRCYLVLNALTSENPIRREIEIIQDAAERAAKLTHQLLAFSRKQILDLCVLDLNATVTGIEPLLRRMIREDIEIATALDSAAGRQRQLAPLRHGVAGVDGQIEQVLLNLAVNASDAMPEGGQLTLATGGRIERGRDLDVLADHATQQGLDSGHGGVQIQHAKVQDLLAAEGQELMRELGGALGGVLDDLDLPPDRVLRGQRVEHEIAAAADGGQQVVEVVGDAGREPPDALHLLGLTELIFQVAALRDVAGHSQSGDRLAVPQDAGHVHLEQDARAILLDELDLEERRHLHARPYVAQAGPSFSGSRLRQ